MTGQVQMPALTRGRRHLASPLHLLVGAVCLSGLSAMVLDAHHAAPSRLPSALDILAAVAIGFMADLALINIRFGRHRYSFTWSEAFVILGVVLVPRPWLVLLAPLGAAVMHLSLRRPLQKAVFNALGLATGAYLASEIYDQVEAIGHGPVMGRPSTWLGLVAASLALFLWSHGTVAGAVALGQQLPFPKVVSRGLSLSVLVWAGNTAVGCGFVDLYLYDHHSVVILPVLLVSVFLMYRSHTSATQEASTWRLLHSSSSELHWLERDGLAASALKAAAGLFEADWIELTLFDGTEADLWRRSRHGFEHRQGKRELLPLVWDRAFAADGPLVVAPKEAPAAEAQELRELGLVTSAVAGMGDDPRALLRLGFSSKVHLRYRDLQILATFANQVMTALINANLYERTLELSEQSRAIAESLGEGVIAIDDLGLITFANQAAAHMVGVALEEMLGRGVHDVLHGADEAHGPGGSCPLLEVLAATSTIRQEDHSIRHSRAGSVPVAFTASPVHRGGGSSGAVIALRDMTERRALEAQLTYQAFHDSTTDVANRSLFLDRLQHVMSRRSLSRAAVLFIDLDRFKLVNDSLGHRAGDALLRQVAQRISSCLRPADTLARWGGDEFTVLVESVESEREAALVAQRILAAMSRPFPAVGRDVVLSVSVGVALGRPLFTDPQEIIHDADVAMYRAKHRGRDTYALFEPDMGDQPLERLELETALRRGLEADEFQVYYQPVVSAQTGRIAGVEALVRWNTENGLLLPAAFIGLAEETGLILPLGRLVLKEACRQVKHWGDEHPGLEPLTLNVNLSACQFQDDGLVEDVEGILTSTGLDPRQLCLEITETVIMQDVPSTVSTLNALKALGVQLSIDDFGTGYSSLSYLKRFPVDTVKIDRSFVDGLGENPVDTEIVAAVVRLARSLGMSTVAEGVETADQLEMLRELGCPLVQGYYFSPAQSGERVEAMLEGHLAPLS